MPIFPLNPEVPRIALDVRLTGPKTWRLIPMVLDTGASLCTISFETALAIGCDPARSNRRVEIMTASSIEVVPVVVIPSIEALGQKVRNLEVVCHDLPSLSEIFGLLGLNFLRHFDLHLNFRSGTLELFR